MARPTKLLPETHAAIVKALALGATRNDAAGAAGVHYTTFLKWLAAGEKARSGKFFEFYHACTKAEHEARLRYLSTIAKAAQDGDWRAALEYLKRRDRANWGDSVDVTSDNRPLRIELEWRTFGEPEFTDDDEDTAADS